MFKLRFWNMEAYFLGRCWWGYRLWYTAISDYCMRHQTERPALMPYRREQSLQVEKGQPKERKKILA